MHLVTFDSDFDLIWRHPTEQPEEISSGMFADADNPKCSLFPKSAHKSQNYLSDHHS